MTDNPHYISATRPTFLTERERANKQNSPIQQAVKTLQTHGVNMTVK